MNKQSLQKEPNTEYCDNNIELSKALNREKNIVKQGRGKNNNNKKVIAITEPENTYTFLSTSGDKGLEIWKLVVALGIFWF